jgi:hypothetical protein
MVDADLEHLDGAMQHRIMQRRQMELARRNRLLDAKRRTLGQDVGALKAQVEEKMAAAAGSAEAKSEDKLEAQYLDSVFALQEKEMSAERSHRAGFLVCNGRCSGQSRRNTARERLTMALLAGMIGSRQRKPYANIRGSSVRKSSARSIICRTPMFSDERNR